MLHSNVFPSFSSKALGPDGVCSQTELLLVKSLGLSKAQKAPSVNQQALPLWSLRVCSVSEYFRKPGNCVISDMVTVNAHFLYFFPF